MRGAVDVHLWLARVIVGDDLDVVDALPALVGEPHRDVDDAVRGLDVQDLVLVG